MILNYFDGLEETIEFLIALGSIIGVLAFIVGLFGLLFLGQFNRQKAAGILIVAAILLIICGLNTGFEYFRIRH